MATFEKLRPLTKWWPLNVLLPPKVTGTFRQDVLHTNDGIYHRIVQELRRAQSQVLVATAWFTDRNLFDILSELVQKGIEVRLILSDVADNEKLPFETLVEGGATLRRIKRASSGAMNQKFCVVDGQLAIHGSYNWTNNARKSNQESVIVTTLEDTVKALIGQFEELEAGQDAEPARPPGRAIKPDVEDTPAPAADAPSGFKAEYAEVLDRMIAAEVAQFDRELLRKHGYERAAACNADPQMLDSAMDTVYSVFINDINVIEDKKKRLLGKIGEQKAVHGAALESRHQQALQAVQADAESAEREATIRIANLKAEAEVCDLELAALKEQKLPTAERVVWDIEERIREVDRESLVPHFKWYEFIPVTILGLGLLSYLVLFYSSAVYILLFSADQARNAQMTGAAWQTPQVFEPKAFSYVLKEGGYAVGFVCLFVCIPLSLSLVGRLSKGSWLSKPWAIVAFTILLDAGIAYKVAASVHEANYAVGLVRDAWNPILALEDSNFYLVFLLGSLGLVLFSALFHRVFALLEERNPDVGLLQLRLRRSQEAVLLAEARDRIAALKDDMDATSKTQIRLRTERHIQELDLAAAARQAVQRQDAIKRDWESDKATMDTTTAIYIAHIENDSVPISLDAMKDRINVFLEGWTDYVNDEYAVVKAVAKSTEAVAVATAWQKERLAHHRIDKRIKAV